MGIGKVMAGFAFVVGLFCGSLALSDIQSSDPVPPAPAAASFWTPSEFQVSWDLAGEFSGSTQGIAEPASAPFSIPRMLDATIDASLPAIPPPELTWSRSIVSGDTLDVVLNEAGLSVADRTEVALALATQYDLRQLRPGHTVTVVSTMEDGIQSVALALDDGLRIETSLNDEFSTQVLTPETEVAILSGEVVIQSSLFATLNEADLPTRFALELAQVLGGTLNFRREITGGETVRLLWREARVDEGRIGQPELIFASLDISGRLYEVVWPENGNQAMIYVDGEMLHVFAFPVEAARLSSSFGMRRHPVYGDVRMHSGIDFDVAIGTPVLATASGRIRFIGSRSGYGRVVEIAHGLDVMTRYAHLSGIPEGINLDQRVVAGDVVGFVGATGTVTGPNLHYELWVNGRPIDPLSEEWLAEAAEHDATNSAAMLRLAEARAQLLNSLGGEVPQTTTERF